MIVPSSLNDGATEFQRKFNGVVDRSKRVLTCWNEWTQDEFRERAKYERFLGDHRILDNAFTRWLYSQNSQQRYCFDQICKKLDNVVSSQLRPLNWFTENLLAREEDIRYRAMATIADSLQVIHSTQSTDWIRPSKKMISAASKLLSEIDRISPVNIESEVLEFLWEIDAGEHRIAVMHEPVIDAAIRQEAALQIFLCLSGFFDFKDGKKAKNPLIQLFLEVVSINVDGRQLRRWLPKERMPDSFLHQYRCFENMLLTDDEFDERVEEIDKKRNRRGSDQSIEDRLELLKRIKLGQYRTKIPSDCPVI